MMIVAEPSELVELSLQRDLRIIQVLIFGLALHQIMGSSGLPWMLKGLAANGPFSEHKEKLELFGQFVGDWIGEATFLKEDGSEMPGGNGEVHFNWILDGRAIQDVWMYEDYGSRKVITGGTTVRFYDPEKDNWQSTWISPLQNNTQTFTGREGENGQIVLEARNRRGQKERWIFFEIEKGSSFSWRAEVSEDEGTTWKPYVRYRLRRAGK